MPMKRPYDHTNPESIEEYGKLLVGKTLRQTVPENDLKEYYDRNPSRHKGGFGEMVEKLYFGISPGNSEGPDFLEAGVELKTNPLIINTQSSRIGIYSAKERLSLNLIKLNQQYAVNLKDENKFYGKNGLIMLMSFMEGDSKKFEDRIFKFARLIRFDDFREDYKQAIYNDWKIIVDKVNSGKVFELSGKHTVYLEACRKDSSEVARYKAFAYKPRFMNTIYDLYLNNIEPTPPIVKNSEAIKEKGFEEAFKEIFTPYFNLDEDVICAKLNREFPSKNKSRLSIIANSIAGVDINKNSQIESRNIQYKTLRLDWDGNPVEDWSFPHFTYKGQGSITEEDWDADEEDLAYPEIKRLLNEKQFAVFVWKQRRDLGTKGRTMGGERYYLQDIVFWRMPEYDIETFVRPVWQKTVSALRNGELNSNGLLDFPKKTFNHVCHIRPHGRNKEDVLPTLRNGDQPKNCFWLDRKYLIQNITLFNRSEKLSSARPMVWKKGNIR